MHRREADRVQCDGLRLALVLPVFLAAFFICTDNVALACASCGSGGDEPMVLFPAETTKVYSGISWTPKQQSTGPDGSMLTSIGPDRRAGYTLAIGQSLNRRSFVVLSGGLVRNGYADRAESGFSDPVISGRWTVVLPNLAQPWIPQVQFLAGYRPALARSVQESEDNNLLDVFGSGFHEIRGGVDVWFGMFPVKPGFALVMTQPLAERYRGILLRPGRLVRGTFSVTALAPTPGKTMKIAAGLTVDRRAASSLNGAVVENSTQSYNGLFLSTDVSILDSDVIKLAISSQGGLGERINAVTSNSLSVGWSRVFR